MRSICLLGAQVAVEGEEWMVLAIDKYDYSFTAYFERKSSLQGNLYLKYVSL